MHVKFFFFADDGAESLAEDGAESLFEFCGRWRLARGESHDEDGTECSLRGKHCGSTERFTRRAYEGPAVNAESPDAKILLARQVWPSMHRFCDLMLKMAPRVLSETGT